MRYGHIFTRLDILAGVPIFSGPTDLNASRRDDVKVAKLSMLPDVLAIAEDSEVVTLHAQQLGSPYCDLFKQRHSAGLPDHCLYLQIDFLPLNSAAT